MNARQFAEEKIRLAQEFLDSHKKPDYDSPLDYTIEYAYYEGCRDTCERLIEALTLDGVNIKKHEKAKAVVSDRKVV